MQLSMSIKGWHSQWFYLKNNIVAPLPEFTRCLIEEAPESWRKWGILKKDKKKIWDHIAAIHILKESGLKRSGVIGAFHARRVASLMTRTLPLYMMAPEASFNGTTLAEGVLPHSEVTQHIKVAMEPPRFHLPSARTSSDAVRTRPCHLRKFSLLIPPLQLIS